VVVGRTGGKTVWLKRGYLRLDRRAAAGVRAVIRAKKRGNACGAKDGRKVDEERQR